MKMNGFGKGQMNCSYSGWFPDNVFPDSHKRCNAMRNYIGSRGKKLTVLSRKAIFGQLEG